MPPASAARVKCKSQREQSKVGWNENTVLGGLFAYMHPTPGSKQGQCHAWPSQKGTLTWGNKHVWSLPSLHRPICICVCVPLRDLDLARFCSHERGWHSRTASLYSLQPVRIKSRPLMACEHQQHLSLPRSDACSVHRATTDTLQLKIAFRSSSWSQGVPNKSTCVRLPLLAFPWLPLLGH